MADPMDTKATRKMVLGWGAIVTGVSILVLVIAIAATALTVAVHSGSTVNAVVDTDHHRDEVGACVSTLQGRWFSGVTAVLITPKGPEQDYWIKVTEQAAVALAHAHDTCYVDNPTPGPDPFVDHPLPSPN